jgi:hypothetical protein
LKQTKRKSFFRFENFLILSPMEVSKWLLFVKHVATKAVLRSIINVGSVELLVVLSVVIPAASFSEVSNVRNVARKKVIKK